MENDEDTDIDKSMADTMAAITESGGSPTSSPEPVPSEGLSPSPAPVGAAPSPTPEPWESLPKAWKKDYEPKWQSFDPEIRRYIHEREKQQLDGIMQYKTVADKWNDTVKPFDPAFKQFGIDPHQAFATITNNHMILKYGTPEQRAAVAKKIIADYNLAEYMQSQGAPAPQQYDPRLFARLDALETTIRTRDMKAAEAEVAKFFSNADNEFAKDLAPDMNRVLEAGLAASLEDAYEMAKWQNQGTRAKLLEREAAKIAGNRKPNLREVRSSDTPPAPTGGASETIDETMANTLARLQNS